MNPPPFALEHRCRVSVLEKEVLWRLEGDVLVRITGELPPFRIPLATVESVRLFYAPTRFQAGRYGCHIGLRGGHSLGLQNEHFEGFATFTDRSESYRSLVLALIRRRAAIGGGCRYLCGTSWLNWIVQTGILFAGFLLLAMALMAFGPITSGMVLVKLGLIVAMVPVAVLWVLKNRPGTFEPSLVPDPLLPPPGAPAPPSS